MAAAAVDPQQSVVMRVANLPLVSSTYDLLSSAYVNTKDQYPYLRSVCEMAEKGVKTVTSAAVTSALPIIQKLEPQIAAANTYACKGLDRMEERLPILNQPTSEVNLGQCGGLLFGCFHVFFSPGSGCHKHTNTFLSSWSWSWVYFF